MPYFPQQTNVTDINTYHCSSSLVPPASYSALPLAAWCSLSDLTSVQIEKGLFENRTSVGVQATTVHKNRDLSSSPNSAFGDMCRILDKEVKSMVSNWPAR